LEVVVMVVAGVVGSPVGPWQSDQRLFGGFAADDDYVSVDLVFDLIAVVKRRGATPGNSRRSVQSSAVNRAVAPLDLVLPAVRAARSRRYCAASLDARPFELIGSRIVSRMRHGPGSGGIPLAARHTRGRGREGAAA
jgi:hypothetical protein